EDGHYLPATAAWLQEASGERIDPALLDDDGHALDQAIVMLRHSHRFDAASGIGELASAVNRGMPAASREVWRRAPGDLVRLAPRGPDDAALKRLVLDGAAPFGPAGPGVPAAVGYRRYLERMRDTRPPLDAARAAFDAWATQVLDEHARFQVLCAVRTGPWGVEGLNQRIAGWLAGAGLIATTQGWYAGRPVLVTRNDYDLGLMNGDVGLCLMLPHEGAWQLRVAFSAADGSGALRWLLPSRLQEVDSLYAMTVHKSQGSEFSHTALILPDTRGPLLTRELVYTGITRARHWLSVVDPAELLEVAMQRRVQRASGLGGLYAG
ncbi:MAG: ATP-binding domain-containing protein, partial [Candidatus Dactylopiibacterium sp.]|nr:ATP-binding domain-containing protein [Candidatus Dactylopiibacterium sp.]